MKRVLFAVLAVWTGLVASAADKPLDPVMGNYEGFWKTPDGKKGRMTAQVRPIGNGNYDGFVALYKSGALETAVKLKSAGSSEPLKFEATSIKTEGGLTAKTDGNCEIAAGKLTGALKGDLGEITLDGKLTPLKSPTMGAKPPKKAHVMFEGKPNDKWVDLKWKTTPEGSMVVSGGDIEAKEKFTNYRLHVEFKTPFMPNEQGQARGNSGVYLQNRYEVQVLDSFGLFPLQNNDCGGIYSIKAPAGNACFPPGEWQTYDITYVQGNPTKRELPTITVIQNGVTVIEKAQIPEALLEKGTAGVATEGGFLRLQDHGNPVEYRNIWVEPFFAADRK